MHIVTALGMVCRKFLSPQSAAYRALAAFYQRLDSLKRQYVRNSITVAVNVTQHCNLNCACCNQFSPLVDEYFYPVETFQNECGRLLAVGKQKISMIGFQGGEPLLHPRLAEFFDIARVCFDKYNPAGRISMISNGLLLLSQPESFWRNCKKNNVTINITNYRIRLDYNAMEMTAKKYGVQFEYIEDSGIIEKTTNRMPFDMAGTQDVKTTWRLCYYANKCINLREGKLYTCPTVQGAPFFNSYFGTHLEISEKDSIDIFKAKNIDEILDFLSKPVPFCRYCNWKTAQTQIPWRTSTKSISEWADTP
jgi:MoaA/NifB/PqqE/SkfB family radical SAM enzyme